MDFKKWRGGENLFVGFSVFIKVEVIRLFEDKGL